MPEESESTRTLSTQPTRRGQRPKKTQRGQGGQETKGTDREETSTPCDKGCPAAQIVLTAFDLVTSDAMTIPRMIACAAGLFGKDGSLGG